MRRIDYGSSRTSCRTARRCSTSACGDGRAARLLIAEKRVHGSGVEIDQAAVAKCIGRGLRVRLAGRPRRRGRRLLRRVARRRHPEPGLQQMRRPRMIVREMVRVGRLAMVSFPNFAHWMPRTQLCLRGHMPVSKDLPYQWWDTPNIHLCTSGTSAQLCREEGLCMGTSSTSPRWTRTRRLAWWPPTCWRASRSSSSRAAAKAPPAATASGFRPVRIAGTLSVRSASQRSARAAEGARLVPPPSTGVTRFKIKRRRRRASG